MKNQNEKQTRKPLSSHTIMHIVFLLVIVAFFAALFIKFKNWGKFVSQEDIAQMEGGDGRPDTFDEILPLFTATENPANDDGVTTILLFGNSPFADGRDSRDGVASMVADRADAVVYNCAIGNSGMASRISYFDHTLCAWDAYNFYWLVCLATDGGNENYYSLAAEVLGDQTPPDAQEVVDTLLSIDMDTVDVAVIMYDATDYLVGSQMYNEDNRTDITCFTGNMEAGIERLQAACPNIRIIVMSPTYAFAVDDDGNYASSDIITYGQDVLSTYSILQYASAMYRGVSFVDNLYGTITEDNASLYLEDNLHLNQKGRELVAERLLYALNYYDHE